MMKFLRVWFGFLMVMMCCVKAMAQGYPNRPITLIIPFPPGGSTDIVGRIVAEGLSKELGQQVVVDNRGGAGGAIGAKAISDAPPDGYTIGVATVSTHVINPIAQAKVVKYDPINDFALISQLAGVPNVVSVHPGVPAQSMPEFIAYLKKNPAKVNYATPGMGSLGHMMGESFQFDAKVIMTHIPYRGAGPALNDALAGQVQVFFDNLPSSLPHIQSGKLRALAVASDKRISALPNVPTFAEAGLPLVNDSAWFGLVGPRQLAPDIVRRLNEAASRVLAQPEVMRRLDGVTAIPIGGSSDAFRQALQKHIGNTRKVVDAARLTFE
ncbi:MAG: tripartite tricarboxylate transporter substrate binding protein BugE [Betaproteobacteria bacterium]